MMCSWEHFLPRAWLTPLSKCFESSLGQHDPDFGAGVAMSDKLDARTWLSLTIGDRLAEKA